MQTFLFVEKRRKSIIIVQTLLVYVCERTISETYLYWIAFLSLLCQILCKTIVLIIKKVIPRIFLIKFQSGTNVIPALIECETGDALICKQWRKCQENLLFTNGIFLGSSLKLSNSWTNANIFFRGKKKEQKHYYCTNIACMYVKKPLVKLIFIGSHFYEKKNEPLGNI